ncbi:uncharacterized protein VTP21DRAFT_4050 [Calcarisporiella thermophila]|uniref:uncharacterized protein n=1 Tax=Calcarisporiella thermophila TaxID=911321 RepID=UPI0037428E12
MQTLQRPDGMKLAYCLLGENTGRIPLIMICGMSMAMGDWHPFCDELAKHRQVLIFDNRGIGKSFPMAKTPLTIEVMVEDIIALANHVGWRDVSLLGFSMGGMLAQHLAMRENSGLRVHRLILTGTAPCMPESPKLYATMMSAVEQTSSGTFDKAAKARYFYDFVALNYTPEWIQNRPGDFRRRLEDLATRKRSQAVLFAQAEALTAHDLREELPKLRLPTLIVHGDGDELIDVEVAKETHRLIPNSRLHILPGVGHMYFDMKPEIAGVIEQFLREGEPKL